MAEEVTSPETARSRRRSENSCATTVGRLDTWHGTATTPTSRSATPVVASDTSRSAVRRSNATGELTATGHLTPTGELTATVELTATGQLTATGELMLQVS